MRKLLVILYIVLLGVDIFAYSTVAKDHRTSSNFYKLPGGGLVALYKYGENKER